MPGSVWEREGPTLECVKFLGSSGSLRLRAQPYTSLACNSLRGRDSVSSPLAAAAGISSHRGPALAPPTPSHLPHHCLPVRKRKRKGERKILEFEPFQKGNTLQSQLIKHQTNRFQLFYSTGKVRFGRAGEEGRKDAKQLKALLCSGKRLFLRG